MSLNMWTVALSFACLAVMFVYVANGAVKFVVDSRERRKTLYRLSASIQLLRANATLVSREPLPSDPCSDSTYGDCSNTMPSRHLPACPTVCSTWPAWGASKGFSERQTFACRTSRGPATVSPPAWIRRESKRLVHGRWSGAWASSRQPSSCGDERRAIKRPNALANPHSSNEYRVNRIVSNRPKFAKAIACKPGQPMMRTNACRVR